MVTIKFNTMNHYQVIQRDNKNILVEFDDDSRPGLGDREPFELHEGEEIVSWDPRTDYRYK